MDQTSHVHLSVAQWSIVDAALNNAESDSDLTNDEPSAEMARSIRQAGWDQIPQVDGQLPPLESHVTVVLPRSQWVFALGEVESTAGMCQELGLHDLAETAQEVVTAVLPQLAWKLTRTEEHSEPLLEDPLLATPLARVQAVAMNSHLQVREVTAEAPAGLTAVVQSTRDESGAIHGGSLTFLRTDLDDATRTELLAFALGLLAVRSTDFRDAPGGALGIGAKLPPAGEDVEHVAGLVLERVGHETTAVNYAVSLPTAELLALLS
ncbi:MAG: hypothetical protein ACT4QF_15755 [Sporichthyaceae bacterium]